MLLEDISTSVSSLRHFKNNLVNLSDESRNFEVGGGLEGGIETILMISSAIDLRGFGE